MDEQAAFPICFSISAFRGFHFRFKDKPGFPRLPPCAWQGIPLEAGRRLGCPRRAVRILFKSAPDGHFKRHRGARPAGSGGGSRERVAGFSGCPMLPASPPRAELSSPPGEVKTRRITPAFSTASTAGRISDDRRSGSMALNFNRPPTKPGARRNDRSATSALMRRNMF